MSRSRIVLGAVGVALGLFGAFRLLTQVDISDVLALFGWLIGALIIHDGILAPAVTGVGAALAKLPGRVRTFVQGGLIAAAFITVIAIPMIYRRNSQPKVKTILQQNYGLNLLTLLAIVLAAAVSLYVVKVLRDRQTATSSTNSRPSDDQQTAGE